MSGPSQPVSDSSYHVSGYSMCLVLVSTCLVLISMCLPVLVSKLLVLVRVFKLLSSVIYISVIVTITVYFLYFLQYTLLQHYV